MSSGDVARQLGVHGQTVARWADEGLLPSIRTAGGHRRYRREDVLEFMRSGGLGAGQASAASGATSGTTGSVEPGVDGAAGNTHRR